MRQPASPQSNGDCSHEAKFRAQHNGQADFGGLPPEFEPASDHGQVSALSAPSEVQTAEQKAEEGRRIRRMQLMMNMVMQVIQQDRSLEVEQASAMVADARRAALAMFPDKALAFDLIFWPRLQRLMRERYRMQ